MLSQMLHDDATFIHGFREFRNVFLQNIGNFIRKRASATTTIPCRHYRCAGRCSDADRKGEETLYEGEGLVWILYEVVMLIGRERGKHTREKR